MKIEYMQKMLISRLEELNGVYSSEFITEMKNNILNEDDIDKLRELDGFATDGVYLQYLRDNIQKKIGSPSLSILGLKNYIKNSEVGDSLGVNVDNLENNIPDRVGILNRISENIVYSGERNDNKSNTSNKLEYESSSLDDETVSLEFEDDDLDDDGIDLEYNSEENEIDIDDEESEDDDLDDGDIDIDLEDDSEDDSDIDIDLEDDEDLDEYDLGESDDIDVDLEDDEDDLDEEEDLDIDLEDDGDLDIDLEEDDDDLDDLDDSEEDDIDIDLDDEDDFEDDFEDGDYTGDEDDDTDEDGIDIDEEDDDDLDDSDDYSDSLLGNHSSEDDDLDDEVNSIVRGNSTINSSNQNIDKPANSHKEKVFNNDFSNNTWDILNGAIDGVSKILRKL